MGQASHKDYMIVDLNNIHSIFEFCNGVRVQRNKVYVITVDGEVQVNTGDIIRKGNIGYKVTKKG